MKFCSCAYLDFLYFLKDLIINKTEYKMAIQIKRVMKGLRINPAKIKPTELIEATKRAYGNLVEMWLIILHLVPVAAMMVVSEIGETWSPKTDPAKTEAIVIVQRSLLIGKRGKAIGMNIAKVPQEVPVENDNIAASAKIITGIKKEEAELFLTKFEINSPAFM